jgi:hypothetical protein
MTGIRRAVDTLRGSAVKIPSTSFHICNSDAPRPAARSAAARSVYPRPTCFSNEPGTGPKKPVGLTCKRPNPSEMSRRTTCDDRHAWLALSYSIGERLAYSVVKVLPKCAIDVIIRRHDIF